MENLKIYLKRSKALKKQKNAPALPREFTIPTQKQDRMLDRPKEWGRLDSNQRKPKLGDLQSPAIATMRHPPNGKKWKRMLAKGLEPSTVRLQGGCSTIELHQR